MAFDCAFSVYGFFGRPACLGRFKLGYGDIIAGFDYKLRQFGRILKDSYWLYFMA